MKYRQIGPLLVSEISFGAWAIGGPLDVGFPVGWGKVDDRQSAAALERAWDLGINFFDTADAYGLGHSEELIGRVLAGKSYVVATKVGIVTREGRSSRDFSVKHVRASVEASLRRLRRESIDLYQLHNPPPEVWQNQEVFDLLQSLKQEGKIHCSGVSISTIEEGVHLIEQRKVDCLQVLINVLQQEPLKHLVPFAEREGIGILARVPLASGMLTGKFYPDHQFPDDDNRKNFLSSKRLKESLQKVDRFVELCEQTRYPPSVVALAFLLNASPVIVPIPGAKTAEQVERNALASGVELDEKLFRQIRNEFSAYNFYARYRVHV